MIEKATIELEIESREQTIKSEESKVCFTKELMEREEEFIKWNIKNTKIILIMGGIALLVICIVNTFATKNINGFDVLSISLLVVTEHKCLFDFLEYKREYIAKQRRYDLDISMSKINIKRYQDEIAKLKEATENIEK